MRPIRKIDDQKQIMLVRHRTFGGEPREPGTVFEVRGWDGAAVLVKHEDLTTRINLNKNGEEGKAIWSTCDP